MRKIILALLTAALLAMACTPLGGNPVHNPIHGPVVSDCAGTHTGLTHHVLSEHDHIGLVTGHVTYECSKIPKLFRLTIVIQTRRPGRVAWSDISPAVTGEFSETLRPRLGHPYLLVTKFECHGPYTAYWRLVQTYSGESSTGVPVTPITVYFPENDPHELGVRFRCGVSG